MPTPNGFISERRLSSSISSNVRYDFEILFNCYNEIILNEQIKRNLGNA